MKLPSTRSRQYGYAVITSLLTVLVAYKLVDAEDVPMWLNVAGTVLGVGIGGTATVALSQQRKTGDVDAGTAAAPDA